MQNEPYFSSNTKTIKNNFDIVEDLSCPAHIEKVKRPHIF